jgi:hypothetical protein
MHLPKDVQEITASWVTETLRSVGILRERSIVSIRKSMVSKRSTFNSQLIRVRIVSTTSLPFITLIAKLPSSNPDVVKQGVPFRAYEHEVAFYTHMASRIKARLPTCYYAQIEARSRCSILLLEDLGDRHIGDEITGFSLRQAKSALKAIATAHAQWWNSGQLLRWPWLPKDMSRRAKLRLRQTYARRWPEFESRYRKELSVAVRKVGTALLHRHPPAPFLAPLSLVHGDFRLGNLMFSHAQTPSPVIIDWEDFYAGPPLNDIAWFVLMGLPEFLRQQMLDLIGYYRTCLLQEGVLRYSYEECLHDFRLACLGRFIQAVLQAMSPTVQRRPPLGRLLARRITMVTTDLGLADML